MNLQAKQGKCFPLWACFTAQPVSKAPSIMATWQFYSAALERDAPGKRLKRSTWPYTANFSTVSIFIFSAMRTKITLLLACGILAQPF